MAKIIFLSDTHLGHDLPVRKTTRAHRGEDFFDNFEFVLNYAIESKADMVIHGGDLFFRAKIPQSIINRVYKIIYDFSKSGIPFVIVPGNHERSRFPRSPLFNTDGVYSFNYPRTFTFQLGTVTLAISGFPYYHEGVRDHFPSILNDNNFSDVKTDFHFLLHHHAVEGCSCGPGNFTFRHAEDVIQMKDIPAYFTALLCGHIHRQQELTKYASDKEIPVLYAGSTERTSFAEMEETKGFYEFNLSKNTKPSLEYFFHKLNARPMFTFQIPSPQQNSDGSIEDELTQRFPPESIIKIRGTEAGHFSILSNETIKRLENSGYYIQVSYPGNREFKRKKKPHRPTLWDQ